ncbi:thioredoxin family protein [Caldibacillus lycopersici]|uniref:Thioredoxin family protein n=1 Tax=Perspicuibacillus lycopersici TaxID=1325689 RepID=A0AAE3LTQ0_9BACI|nr:thioredoxin family protein [Perspicuibacillus lycopersici]MCU9614338.1 thioredoxin family protein [Perspicuibacillus lycopersici]
MTLNEWFEKGMTFSQYIEQMTRNKESMLSVYEKLQLSNEQVQQLEGVKERQLRAIALTEDWCGDAMVNNPVLMRIAEAANIDVRFLLRDQNLELMDQYLTNGKSRSIPIYVFLDQEGQEYAVWGPRAAEVQAFVDEERAKLPAQDAPDFLEKQKEMHKKMVKRYMEDETVWQQVTNSIISRLQK